MTRGDDRNVLLTGLPRSGTNLSCALLNRLPQTIALAEPMDVDELGRAGDKSAAMAIIERFLAAQRASLLSDRIGFTRHSGGQVRENFFSSQVESDGLRHSRSERGDVRFEKPLDADFRLIVKHPAAFTALLPELAGAFTCAALVRNPLAVLGSWNSNRIPVREGRAPAAEAIDARLRDALDAIPGRLARQIHLLDWFFARFLDGLPAERIIRYESLVASGGAALQVVVPAAAVLHEPLESRNASGLYAWDSMQELARMLIESNGSYWRLYHRHEVEHLLSTARRGRD